MPEPKETPSVDELDDSHDSDDSHGEDESKDDLAIITTTEYRESFHRVRILRIRALIASIISESRIGTNSANQKGTIEIRSNRLQRDWSRPISRFIQGRHDDVERIRSRNRTSQL